jgi:precorrin-6x reductase
LGLPVVMVARPSKPPVETYHSVDAIAVAIASR